MRRLTIAFILITILGVPFLSAQPMDVDKLKSAQKELDKQEYYTALEWFVEAYEDGEDNIQDNIDVIHNIASLYYKLRNYRKAASWYRKLVKKDDAKKYPNAGYYLGTALKIDGKYDEANTAFDNFIAASSDDKMKALAKIQKQGIDYAKGAAEADPNIIVQNRSLRQLNTAYTEWSPFYADDNTIYYTGLLSDELMVKKDPKGDYFSKIYKSSKTEDDWMKGQPLGTNVNKFGTHTGNVTMSNDGKYLYYTRCTMAGSALTGCDIFVSEWKDNNWTEGVKVEGLNSDDFMSKQPAFGKINGKNALFFASDMPGGKGGWDLYYAVLNTPTASDAPVNLGGEVNTIGDDETPFFKDDQLYFSSNGHPSLGGYDIFVADQKGVTWSNVDNLGKSINTEFDDMYFVLDKSGYNGFLVSNRKGVTQLPEGETFDKEDKWRTSGDDLFQITFPKEILAGLDVRTFTQTETPLKGVTVTVTEIGAKKGTSQNNPRGNTFNFPLELEKEYKIVAKIGCYFTDSVLISTMNLQESRTFLTEFVLKKVPPKIVKRMGKKVKTFRTGEPIVLKNIYFDFNKDNIRPDAEPELTKIKTLMEQYPDMVIELSSHTDSRGNDTYNQRLSQRRANSSKQWLVEKGGITAERIQAVGKGESMLLNRCANGVNCEEEEHQLNRRTEFSIISGPDSITTDIIEDELYEIIDTIPCQPKIEGTGSVEKEVPTTELVFDTELYDFGEVKLGETVEHTFTLTNIGDYDLLIEFASGSCGCTVPDFPKNAIPPGGKGEIKVVYTAKEDKPVGLEDEQEVTVIANTEPIVSMVKIKAKVVE